MNTEDRWYHARWFQILLGAVSLLVLFLLASGASLVLGVLLTKVVTAIGNGS